MKVPASKVPLILDGAMGTELMLRGLKLSLPLWSSEANITDHKLVREVHTDYVEAGADISTANTFRSTTWTYRKAGYSPRGASDRARTSFMKAIDHARASNPSIVAGSVTCIDDCYLPNLYPGDIIAEDIYGETSNWFREAGIKVVLLETMGRLDEISIALNAMSEFNAIWLSLIMKDKDHLLSGSKIHGVYKLAEKLVSCLMLNCNTLDKSDNVIPSLVKDWNGSWGVYPNLGLSEPEPDGTIEQRVEDDIFREKIVKYLKLLPSIIGSCCGSSPHHIKLIKKEVKLFFQID